MWNMIRSNMDINPQTFEMLLEKFQTIERRFDKVDEDNDDIKRSIAAHVKDDKEFHESVSATVGRHGTYWSLFLWISGATIVGSIGAFLKGLIK